nr:LysE family transporter [Paenibacillus guangzhouensis]
MCYSLFASFAHGFLLALGLILPLGVQNVFVFNQGALQPKFRQALPVVITAALCDTLLLTLAILGVSVLILSVPLIKSILLFAGVLFLLYMGYVTWRSQPTSGQGNPAESYSARRQITYALSVSLLNPHALMDTIGVIGTSSLNYSGTEKWIFALSCILVSWAWFFALALAGRFVGSLSSSGRFIPVLNRISACIIWGSALLMIYLW